MRRQGERFERTRRKGSNATAVANSNKRKKSTYCKPVRALSADGNVEFSQLPDAEKYLRYEARERVYLTITHAYGA